MPRDRDASFEPKIVHKRQRRLSGVDEMVISLAAKDLTIGEISAHLAEVYGAEVSKRTISTITDKVLEGMTEWQNRPLDAVYPVVFIDAIHVKIRDGQVANRPAYVALAVTADGERDILGLWAGDGGEGAKFWLHVLTEIKNRGVADVLMLVGDGLKGLPQAIEQVWHQAVVQTCVVQTCVVHLLRASFRYAARQHWDAVAKALRPVYTAPTEAAALERFTEFGEAWGGKLGDLTGRWPGARAGAPVRRGGHRRAAGAKARRCRRGRRGRRWFEARGRSTSGVRRSPRVRGLRGQRGPRSDGLRG